MTSIVTSHYRLVQQKHVRIFSPNAFLFAKDLVSLAGTLLTFTLPSNGTDLP